MNKDGYIIEMAIIQLIVKIMITWLFCNNHNNNCHHFSTIQKSQQSRIFLGIKV